MTVAEAAQILENIKNALYHGACPELLLALSMAIAVLKSLSPGEIATVNLLYSVELQPLTGL